MGLGLLRAKPYLGILGVNASEVNVYTFMATSLVIVVIAWYFYYCGAGKSFPRIAIM